MELTQTIFFSYGNILSRCVFSPHENRMIFRAYHLETVLWTLFFSFGWSKLFCKEYGNRKSNNNKKNPLYGHMYTFQRNDTFDTMENKTKREKVSIRVSTKFIERFTIYVCLSSTSSILLYANGKFQWVSIQTHPLLLHSLWKLIEKLRANTWWSTEIYQHTIRDKTQNI